MVVTSPLRPAPGSRSWAPALCLTMLVSASPPEAGAAVSLPEGTRAALAWEEGTATSAAGGETLLLEDGREVRLTGIVTPAPEETAAAERFAREARAALDALAAGRRLRLGFEGSRLDRYGRMLDWLLHRRYTSFFMVTLTLFSVAVPAALSRRMLTGNS